MEWFKFHTIWGSGLQELSDAEAGRFIKAICNFAETGEAQTQFGNERFLYSIALKQMKNDAEYTARISSIRAEARRGKSLKSEQMITNENKTYQTETNENKNNNTCIKNKEIRIKNTEKEKEEDINKATKVAVRPKLTPNQPDFWKRAFGPEAGRAQAFSEASGIVPIGTEFGRWQKDLRDFTEAGITIDRTWQYSQGT